MKAKISQKERIIKRLLQENCISRNACLQNFISRLSAIIYELEDEGWVFEAKFEKKTERGQDYVYYVKHCPFKKVERFVPGLEKTIVSFER